MTPNATPVTYTSDTSDVPYKEEQDSFNKTTKQDLLNNTSEEEKYEIKETAQRIINILGLPDSLLKAATVVSYTTEEEELFNGRDSPTH